MVMVTTLVDVILADIELYGDCVACPYLNTKCDRISRPISNSKLMHDLQCQQPQYYAAEEMIGFMNISTHIDKEIYREGVRKRALKPAITLYFIIGILLRCFFACIAADIISFSKFMRSRWRPISLWAWRISITIIALSALIISLWC